MDLPKKLNIGSGKSFLEDHLNLDVSPFWRPDIVADLNRPFPADPEIPYPTDRFGPVLLPPACMEEVLALDVLEHIQDLAVCMKSCLDLLVEGGRFRISVPYELSLGAWSDPTHVRTFNERSWIYFTDWFWYWGWTTHRFQQTKLLFLCSEHGENLREQGKELDELLRINRAIDAMQVELVKVPLNENEKHLLDYHRSRSKPVHTCRTCEY